MKQILNLDAYDVVEMTKEEQTATQGGSFIAGFFLGWFLGIIIYDTFF